MQAQMGIAAYLRNIAVRCNHIARACPDAKTHDALASLTTELPDKADILETAFRIPKDGG